MRNPVSIFLPLDAHGFGTIEVCVNENGVAIEARIEHPGGSSATTYLSAAKAVEFLTEAINLIVDECVS
jgi:hypothetical protein